MPFTQTRVLLAAMELDFRAFAFIIALAAVINGLGMTRLLFGFSEYLRRRGQVEISHSGLFGAWAGLQFILHILLWWQMWTVQEAATLTFLTYIYLLQGPILLFLGTSLLLPDLPEGPLDLADHYERGRKPFFTVSLLFWLWAVFLGLVLEGAFRPAAPLARHVRRGNRGAAVQRQHQGPPGDDDGVLGVDRDVYRGVCRQVRVTESANSRSPARGRICHLPRVKSGNSIGRLPWATDHSDSGVTALNAAAS